MAASMNNYVSLTRGTAGSVHRSSRRFACDRCRTYKARCERNVEAGASCERCIKASLTCVTSFGHDMAVPSTKVGNHEQQYIDNSRVTSNWHTTNISGQVLPAPTSVDQPPGSNVPSPRRVTPSPSPSLRPGTDRQYGFSGIVNDDFASVLDTSPSHQRSDSSGSFQSSLGQNMLSGGRHGLGGSDLLEAIDSTGEPGPMDFSIEVAMPHHDLIFDESDFTMSMDEAPKPQRQASTASTLDVRVVQQPAPQDSDTSSVTHTGSIPQNSLGRECASDLAIALQGEPDNDSYKDLLQLSVALAEDQEALGGRMAMTGHYLRKSAVVLPTSPEECPISPVLKRTSRLLHIVKTISQDHGDLGKRCTVQTATKPMPGQLPWSRTCPSILSIIQVLTAYVSLVRLCRDSFMHLYNVLQVVPPKDLDKVIHLPSLQFGEFRMDNNIGFQVQALIQLNTSMLLRIEEALGISTGTISGLSGSSTDCQPGLYTQARRQTVMSDPIAASLREMILSHERTRMAATGKDQPTLMTILSNLTHLLQ